MLTAGRAALGAGLLALALYLLTLNPTFGFIDKGELVAVASTLGIAHPTGYPTIMLLGKIFTLLLPVRDVLALNIMAAVLTAASVAVMTLLFDYLLLRMEQSGTQRPSKRRGPEKGGKKMKRKGRIDETRADAMTVEAVEQDDEVDPGRGLRALYAGGMALLLGLTATWWNQGNGFEVYSLHALLMALATLLFLRWVDAESVRPTAGFSRLGTWFAVVLGLGFTNHMTMVLLAPAFLVYYFWRMKGTDHSITSLLYLIPGFIAGLLPYAWLPIRAAMNPIFNWGDPDSMKRFVDHVTGKQYRVWMFSSSEVFEQQTAYFFKHLPEELAWIGLALALLGIVWMCMRSAWLMVWTTLLFLTCVLYAGWYDIMEIGPYYMTAVFAVVVWMLAGVRFLHERIGSSGALGAMALLVVLVGAINYSRSNERGNVLVEDMTYNMIETMPRNAIIISSQWDFWVSGSWYMQAVEKMRPDVVVVDPELIRRSWYIDQLQRHFPDVMSRVKPEVDRFLPLLLQFEHDEPYDPVAIQSAYVGLINAMIDKNMNDRPVFVTGEVMAEVGAAHARVPNNLALRLVPMASAATYLPEEFPKYRFRFWEGRVESYAARTYELYARSLVARSLYELRNGRDSLADRYYKYALTFNPGYTMDDVEDLPLNSEEQLIGTINFFDQLRTQTPQQMLQQ